MGVAGIFSLSPGSLKAVPRRPSADESKSKFERQGIGPVLKERSEKAGRERRGLICPV